MKSSIRLPKLKIIKVINKLQVLSFVLGHSSTHFDYYRSLKYGEWKFSDIFNLIASSLPKLGSSALVLTDFDYDGPPENGEREHPELLTSITVTVCEPVCISSVLAEMAEGTETLLQSLITRRRRQTHVRTPMDEARFRALLSAVPAPPRSFFFQVT